MSPIPNSSKAIYCVKFNYVMTNKDIFAAGVRNKVFVYECLENEMKQLASYEAPNHPNLDPNCHEYFYTLDWSYDNRNGNSPVLAAAGEQGVIRLMFTKPGNMSHLIGHSKLPSKRLWTASGE